MILSIIIPVYNGEDFIERCVNSILKSGHRHLNDWEIIIVNDGSTDGTSKICKKIENQNPNVVFITETNKGVSSARNLGIECAKGEYISFCDADDYVLHSYVDSLLNILKSSKANKIDMLLFDYATKENIKIQSSLKNESLDSIELIKRILSDDVIGGFVWNKIYRKSCIGKIRFHEDIDICEDLFFNMEFLSKPSNFNILYIRKMLYIYIDNENSASRKITNLFNKNDNLKYSITLKKLLTILPLHLHRFIYSKIFSCAVSVYITNIIKKKLSKKQISILHKDMRDNVFWFITNRNIPFRNRIKFATFYIFPYLKLITNK